MRAEKAEVVRLLKTALPGRDRTLLDVAYSCGLRLQELLGLQVRDIDSAPPSLPPIGLRILSRLR